MKPSDITITDMFCGAGGSSSGAAETGVRIYYAFNHDALCLESHNTNFPNTHHDLVDVRAVNPRRYKSTTILIASPECTNQTSANGKKQKQTKQRDWLDGEPIDEEAERSRATMWDVPRFAELHSYELIIVENVPRIRKWVMFDSWIHAMTLLGYDHQIVYLNSMFAHPTPQSRNRFYCVFWKRGNKRPDLEIRPLAHCEKCGKSVNSVQSWSNPDKKWGRWGNAYKQQYVYRCPVCTSVVEPFYYCALNALDLDVPIEKIGEKKRPLKPNTLARTRAGARWVANQPLIIPLAYTHAGENRAVPVVRPMPAQTTKNNAGIAFPPFLLEMHKNGTGYRGLHDPMFSQTTKGKTAVVVPFLMSYYGNNPNYRTLNEVMGTVTTKDRHALVAPEEEQNIDEWGFRMLKAHEVGRAMAFADDYIVLGNSAQKVHQYGNAVTPPVMKLLMERCIATLQ